MTPLCPNGLPNMQFMQELQDFLESNRRIFSVRKFRMKTSMVMVNGEIKCKRIFIQQVSSNTELLPHVSESGFSNLGDWWTKIKHHIPSNGPYYLYKVELLPKPDLTNK